MFSSWSLAREYGFTDLDGSRPDWRKHVEEKYGRYRTCDDTFYQYWHGEMIEMVFPDWP